MKREERLQRIEEMKAEIERRGGIVHVDLSLPLDITEQFLQDVLDCAECGGTKGRSH